MNMENFIKEIHLKPCIWQRQNKDHRNRQVLDKEWDCIAGKFNITRDVARSKWKSLRDKFRIELSRIPNKQIMENSDEAFESISWIHFKNLLFLKDQFLTTYESKILKSELEKYKMNYENRSGGVDNFVFFAPQSPSDAVENIEVIPQLPTSPEMLLTNPKQQSREEMIRETLINAELEKLKFLEEWRRKVYDEEDDIHFFKSIVSFVKDLPPMVKTNFRVKVMKAVQEAIYN